MNAQICNLQAERETLIEFYNQTNGNNWENSWDIDAPTDEWYGVRLNSDGCVLFLELDANYLVGSLPDLALPFLRRLSLSNNKLSGSIPDFTHLTTLTYLNVANNFFSGSIPNFTQLPNVYYLNLNANILQGEIPDFSNMPSLNILHLNRNQLTHIHSDLVLRDLTTLDLSRNQLLDVPDFTVTQPSVHRIYFNHNALTFSDILPNVLLGDSLTFRYHSQAKIGEPTTVDLAVGDSLVIDLAIDDEIETNEYRWFKDTALITVKRDAQFKIMINSSEDFGTYHAEVTNPRAPNLTLRSHHYQINGVQGGVCNPTAERAELLKLYEATDGFNWTTNWDLTQPISTWHGVFTNENGCVVAIDLDGTADRQISSATATGNNLIGSLPQFYLPFLEELYLGNNNFGTSNLPSLEYLPNLRSLDLSGCNLSEAGGGLKTPALEELYLNKNRFRYLSNITRQLRNLRVLELNHNQLFNFGGINNSLPQLVRLDLSHNRLSRSLDPLHQLSQLRYLDLSHNELNSGLEELQALSLESLYLNDNLFGSFLPDLSAHANLHTLHLENNSFHGPMRNYSIENPDLRLLQLNGNKLSETATTQLANLSLTTLNIANNNLTELADLTNVLNSDNASCHIENNRFSFADLVPNQSLLNDIDTFSYAPQQLISLRQLTTPAAGAIFTLMVEADDRVTGSTYEWFQDGELIAVTEQNQLSIPNFSNDNLGSYHCEFYNVAYPNFRLITKRFEVSYCEQNLLAQTNTLPEPLLIPDNSTPANTIITIPETATSPIYNGLDELKICVEIEHSWMRDLNVALECPNGQQINLQQFAGQSGSGVYLGEPTTADDSIPRLGTAYKYCWAKTDSLLTWTEWANQNDDIGFETLPVGDYAPSDDFANLAGCPITGDWTLIFTDNWEQDNGFVVSASITTEVNAGVNILQQPQDVYIATDSSTTAIFTVASNHPNTNYLWEVSRSGNDFVLLATETSPTLTLRNISDRMNGWSFRCQITNECGTAVSEPAFLYVNSPLQTDSPRALQADPNLVVDTQNEILVYPNPVSHELTIKSVLPITSYQIITVDGKMLQEQNGEIEETLNIEALPVGYYFLHLHTQKGITVKHFVKE